LKGPTGSLFPTFQIPKWEGWRWSVFSPGGILKYELSSQTASSNGLFFERAPFFWQSTAERYRSLWRLCPQSPHRIRPRIDLLTLQPLLHRWELCEISSTAGSFLRRIPAGATVI